MKNNRINIASKFLTLGCVFGIGLSTMSAATWKIEAEKVGTGSISKILPGQPPVPSWTIEKVADAIDGNILSGYADGETHPIPVVIPTAGTYRVWVRHYHTEGLYTSFYVLFRDSLGQAV
ncbi:MAG: hypothetical protein ABI443_12585, partial [Chthoniobacterales bacterium]